MTFVLSYCRSNKRRVVLSAFLFLMLTPLLAGCLRVQVSMGVSANDRVSGQIVAATIPISDGDTGPMLVVPDSLTGKVTVESYKQDGYVGSQAYFSNLTFGEVQQLGSLSDKTGGSIDLTLQRTGDLVTLTGKADLQAVPVQGSDVQFTIAFPSRVSTTNGTQNGDNIVDWKLAAGQVTNLSAEVRYADPNTRSFAGWAGIVGGVTVGIAAIVAAMAWVSRESVRRNSPERSRRE